MENLPRDIALDILSRLPAWSIMQFKCVCRAWHSLSQDPRLPHMHLTRLTKNDPCLILQCFSRIRNQLYFVDNDAQGYSKAVKEIDTALKYLKPEFEVVDSCNGLLCISDMRYYTPLYIWNPFAGTHIELPKATGYKDQDVVFGFGFHPITKEYKVVRTVYYKLPCTELIGTVEYMKSEVQVFTLGTDDAWRSKGDLRYRLRWQPAEPAVVNGALHWVAYSSMVAEPNTTVVSFDLVEENFQEVPRPDCGRLDEPNFHLLVLRGCLSAAVYCSDGSIEIWVMKDYNVKESWTKEFIIGNCVFVSRGWQRLPRVLCLLKNGEILLQKSKGLFSYNPKSGEFKDLKIHGVPNPNCFSTVLLHVRSLISAEVAFGMQR